MTTTSYACLGLLAVRPWTAYELVQQVDLSLRRMWPRAQSKVYEEPKKLVELGYAVAAREDAGRRTRTRYAITDAGRHALREWLAAPGAGPVLEFEQLLKIHLADAADTAAIRANLDGTLTWVREQNEANLATARAYAAGEGAFPERAAVNQLVGRFLTDYYAMVAGWARWAQETVATWPDDPRQAVADTGDLDETARRAQAVAELTDGRLPSVAPTVRRPDPT